MPFTLEKTQDIEAHLSNNPYLSEGGLPGVEDARIFLALNRVAPDVTKTPNFHHWFNFLGSFTNELLQSWVDKADGKKADDKKPVGKKEDKKKEEKKEQKKEQKKAQEEELDPFADDAPAKPAAPVAPKPQAQQAKKKEKPAAKSIVVFEVKVYDQETNLDDLAKKILERKMEGLVWNNEPKKVDVAYGMQKLQIGCVIEDEKILTDDIFDPIAEWPEVQSVDMTSMQKL